MSENIDPNFAARTPIDAPALEVKKPGRKRVHHTEEQRKEANKLACRGPYKRKKSKLAVLHDSLKNCRADPATSQQEVADLTAAKAAADGDAETATAERSSTAETAPRKRYSSIFTSCNPSTN